jgi:hypothetical protein
MKIGVLLGKYDQTVFEEVIALRNGAIYNFSVRNCGLTPSKQFFSYIMTINIR